MKPVKRIIINQIETDTKKYSTLYYILIRDYLFTMRNQVYTGIKHEII